MLKVRLIGDASSEWSAALETIGATADANGEVAIVLQAEDQESALRDLSREGVPTLAIVGSADAVDPVLEFGATAAGVGLPEPDGLSTQLGALRRLATTWRQRLAAQQRRAKRAVDDLASTQDLLGRLIDATPNAVVAVDPKGRILVFNRAAEAALGYEARWAREHMHVTDIYADPSEARRVLEEIRTATNGLVSGLETLLRTRWGEALPVALSAAEVTDAEGQPIATVGVFIDMREQRSLTSRLEETTAHLVASEKRAAAMEVAGAAAHELNQPLTAVMGSLELLELRTDLPEDVHARLKRTYAQLGRMGEIVRALARTSRTTADRYGHATSVLRMVRDFD